MVDLVGVRVGIMFHHPRDAFRESRCCEHGQFGVPRRAVLTSGRRGLLRARRPVTLCHPDGGTDLAVEGVLLPSCTGPGSVQARDGAKFSVDAVPGWAVALGLRTSNLDRRVLVRLLAPRPPLTGAGAVLARGSIPRVL